MNKIKKMMLAVVLVGVCAAQSASAVTLNTSFGILSKLNGDPLDDGSLLQLIASIDNVLDDGDLLIQQWGLDSSTSGMLGGDENSIQFNLGELRPAVGSPATGQLVGGLKLFLRWFDGPAGTPSTPFGVYRDDNPPLGAPWVIPGDNSATVMIALNTESYYGGPLPDEVGRVIPEPATGLLVGLSLLGVASLIRRR